LAAVCLTAETIRSIRHVTSVLSDGTRRDRRTPRVQTTFRENWMEKQINHRTTAIKDRRFWKEEKKNDISRSIIWKNN